MSAGRLLLRIVRGEPTEEELAALVLVLGAATARRPAEDKPVPRSLWSDRSAQLRRPVHPGPNAWRASALRR